MAHELKCWPEFFKAVWCGDKTFEIRRTDDRFFQERDELILQEYDPNADDGKGSYTGRQVEAFITYVTGFEQRPGWVVFGFREVHRVTE